MPPKRLYWFVTLDMDFPGSGATAAEIHMLLTGIAKECPLDKMKVEYPGEEAEKVTRKKAVYTKHDFLAVNPSKAPAEPTEA